MEEKIYIYHTAPNQRSVITRKTQSDDVHLYGKCNIEATLMAARDLSDRAFKMYIRMNLHQDGYSYALSPAATEHETGMSEKRYRLAVQELISKGYLVQHEKHKFIYYFYEYPRKDRGIVGNVDSSRPPDLAGLLGDSDGKEASMQSNEGQHKDERGYRSSDEIQHSITSDKTYDNKKDINICPSTLHKEYIHKNSMDGLSAGYQEAMRQVEAIRSQQKTDSEAIIYYDDDDIYLMEQPEDRTAIDAKDIADEDMPF